MNFFVRLVAAIFLASSVAVAAEEVTFSVKLLPVANLGGTVAVEFDGGSLRVTRGAKSDTIQLSQAESKSLAGLISETRKEEWFGWWYCEAIDGDLVFCTTRVGEESFSFRGSNGCPPGFAAILLKLNEVSGRQIFPDHWSTKETNSEHYEKDPLRAFRDQVKSGKGTPEDLKRFFENLRVKPKSDQDGADQPATAPESKPKDNSRPQSESEARPQ